MITIFENFITEKLGKVPFIRIEKDPYNLTKAEGEAGYGIYFSLSKYPNMIDYYKKYTPNGYRVIYAYPKSNTQIHDFTTPQNLFKLLNFIKDEIDEQSKKMSAGYVKPKINKSNYQRYSYYIIPDYIRKELNGDVDAYIVNHDAYNIPKGKQLIIINEDSFEYKEIKKEKSFENFITEKYIHYINIKPNCIIDPLVDFKHHLSETKENADYITKFLRNSGKSRYQPSCLIKVYHGTNPKLTILKDGLKTTKIKTAHTNQSTLGYTYFSIYPSSAKAFGDMGWGINNSVVYECLIPICEIEPDKDQLKFCHMYSSDDEEIGDSIGDSIVYGHGIRVKGDIPPYMIKIHNE
jgi:hypothetical protein